MHLASSSRLTDRASWPNGLKPTGLALSPVAAPALADRTRVLIALAFAAAVALLLIFSGSAFAQAAASPDDASDTTPLGAATRAAGEGADPNAVSDEGGTGGLVRTIIGLAVVIAVIYGITWILKQAKIAKEPQDVGYGLAPAATLSLGGTRSVQLVRAGQEYLLLGVTDDGVSLLRSYTETEALEAGFPVSGDDDDDLGPFKPIGETTASGFGPQLMERVRELTVRR